MKTWTTRNGYTITRVLSGRSNVFLVSYQTTHVLIDTSVKRNWTALKKNLTEILAENGRLAALILTHTHFDHCANTRQISDNYHCPVILHKLEAENLKKGRNAEGDGSLFLTKLMAKALLPLMDKIMNYPPAIPDTLVDEKYDLSPWCIHAYILHTPGHTEGSVSVIIDNEIAVVGDAMFGVYPNSIFPPYALDTPKMVQSWEKLLDTGCKTFLPAHGSENSRSLVEKEYNKHIH